MDYTVYSTGYINFPGSLNHGKLVEILAITGFDQGIVYFVDGEDLYHPGNRATVMSLAELVKSKNHLDERKI